MDIASVYTMRIYVYMLDCVCVYFYPLIISSINQIALTGPEKSILSVTQLELIKLKSFIFSFLTEHQRFV